MAEEFAGRTVMLPLQTCRNKLQSGWTYRSKKLVDELNPNLHTYLENYSHFLSFLLFHIFLAMFRFFNDSMLNLNEHFSAVCCYSTFCSFFPPQI